MCKHGIKCKKGGDVCNYIIEEQPDLSIMLSKSYSDSHRGYVYEFVSKILVLTKLIGDYDIFYHYEPNKSARDIKKKYRPIVKSSEVLLKNLHTGSDCGVDIYTEKDGEKMFYSVKSSPKISFESSGVTKIHRCFNSGFENISVILNDRMQNPNDEGDRKNKEKLTIYSKEDISDALDKLYKIFEDNDIHDVHQLCDFIDNNYLRRTLKNGSPYFHQEIFHELWKKNLMEAIAYHYLHYKCRSGKTYTHLKQCLDLLKNGMKKILFLTPCPNTIETEYKRDLNVFCEFQDLIPHCYFQHDGHKLKKNFEGVYFCSLQWTKGESVCLGKKAQIIKNIGFDYFILDEAHIGALTSKTQDILSTIPKGQYTSGTLDFVEKCRNVNNSYLYVWDLTDEALMKSQNYSLLKAKKCKNKDEEEIFDKVLNNPLVNKDYSEYPTQVLLTPNVDNLREFVKKKREEYEQHKGVDFSKYFRLQRNVSKKSNKNPPRGDTKSSEIKKEKKKSKFEEKLYFDDEEDGTKMLIKLFKMVYDTDPNNSSTMIHQYKNFCKDHNEPHDSQVIIMFLPILHEDIKSLQEAVKEFLEAKKLFPEWHIVTSNENLSEKEMLRDMKEKNKQKVLFLTGLKGGTGTTFRHCSITIHFDNSSSLVQYVQHYYRAATPKKGHQYFFTLDMNIHRSFRYQYELTQKLSKSFKYNMEDCYLYIRKHNLLHFNPPKHCPEFKMSIEDKIELYKKDWCSINSSMEIHKFLKNLKFQASTIDNSMDMDILKELASLILPFISKLVFVLKKNEKTNDDNDDNDNDDDGISNYGENANDELKPLEKKEKIKSGIRRSKKKNIATDEEVVMKFFELFLNHVSFWMFINQISLDQVFEKEELIFEILEKFIDFEKLNFSSIDKDSLFQIMKKSTRLNSQFLELIQYVYQNKHFKQIREELEKMLVVSEKEKNERGFVITPSSLAEKMMSKIPNSFWKKNQSVLDPCCGYGIFPLLAFELFDRHLPIRDKEKRVRTIIEKCIFFSDISSYNVKITKALLQFHCDKVVGRKVEGLKFNCWVGNTLTLNYKRKFDLVVGNPPYQRQVASKNTEPIWHLFVEKSLSLLNKDAYMVLVHPSGWRDVHGRFEKTKELIMSKTILYLNMNDYKEGLKVFNCGTNFDYYVIQNNNQYRNTEINDIDGKTHIINLKTWKFIPSGKLNIYKKLIAKPNEPKCHVLYDTTYHTQKQNKELMSKEKIEKFKYPCVYSITIKDGIKCFYSSENKGHFGIPKVIWSNGGGTYPIVDNKGQYGMTEFAYAIIDEKKNLKNIEKALNNKSFLELMKYVKITQDNKYNRKVISLFKKDWYKQFL